MSISNLYNAFDTIYEGLDTEAITSLGSTANDIKDTFGSADSDGMFPMLIGTAVLGAASACVRCCC